MCIRDRNDTGCSVSNCDICALAKKKQQNHPKVARIEVTQSLELVYTDLSGPISPASGAGNSYVAKFTDHHTRLKSVYFLSKKNEAIDDVINYTQDVVIPSGHRLQRFARTVEASKPDWNNESTAYRPEPSRNLRQRSHRSKMAFQNVSGRLYRT